MLLIISRTSLKTVPGRVVSTATVLIGAVLVPLQLSEIAQAAMQAQFESGEVSPSKAPSEPQTRDVPVALPPERIEALFDAGMECRRCHLKVHQTDARFCRNCSALLAKKRFD